jgi:hypothetical protein
MIFDRLNHYGVLKIRPGHLHPAACSDARMRNVSVATDFIRRINNDHALDELRREHARAFSQERGFSYTGPAQQEQALSRLDDVAKHVDCTEHGPAHTTGQSDHHIASIANSRYPVQRAFDSGSVILGKGPNAVDYIIQIFSSNRGIAEVERTARKAGFGWAAEVHHDLDEIFQIRLAMQSLSDVGWHDAQKQFEVVCDFPARQIHFSAAHIDLLP